MKPFSEADARKAVDETRRNLRKGGTVMSPGGQMNQAASFARVADAQEQIRKLSSKVPLGPEDQGRYEGHSNVKTASNLGNYGNSFGGTGSLLGYAQGGIPAYTDPLHSPARWGIPTWTRDMPENLREQLQVKCREWCDWYYHNHAIVPTCMNIYATYPFVGLDMQCPDPQVEDEYRTMFLDQLNYPELLPKANLEYWKVGEAPMLGSWDEAYSGWVDERVLNPDHVKVVNWPGIHINRESYFWYPPDDLINILKQADPTDPIYQYYVESFGMEQIQYWMEGNPSELPGEIFSVLRHNMDLGGSRGYPLLMQAFAVLMKEEKLNQAMTSVADRLYTPFIVAKLGSPNILQGQYPWIPTQEDLKEMQTRLEVVMTSKHRVMVYHSGIEFENPFSNQTIPDLNDDFDRATKEIMGVFGIAPELVYGGSSGTYASGAVSAEIMMQRLAASQKLWSRWIIQERAKRVAEARGYYAIERKGMSWSKPMERVREWDPESGSYRMRTRRKLLLPAIRMETMNWRDENQTVEGMMNLKKNFNAPIPNQYFASFYDSNFDMDSARQQYREEKVSDFEMQQSLGDAGAPEQPGGGGMGGPPGMGRPPGASPGGSPGGPPGGGSGGSPSGAEMPGGGNRPPQSDEQRSEQPQTQSSYVTHTGNSDLYDHVFQSEKDSLNEKFSSLEEEERELYESNYERDEEVKASSYAEDHMFSTFRAKGTKTGTTYYLQGDRLIGRRTK